MGMLLLLLLLFYVMCLVVCFNVFNLNPIITATTATTWYIHEKYSTSSQVLIILSSFLSDSRMNISHKLRLYLSAEMNSKNFNKCKYIIVLYFWGYLFIRKNIIIIKCYLNMLWFFKKCNWMTFINEESVL